MVKHRLPRPVSPRTAALLVALALIGGLSLGLVLGATHPELVTGPAPTAPSEAPTDDPRSVAGQPDTFAVFWEAWGIIHEKFLDHAALEDRRLTHGAIRGLLQSLADPNTSFQTPEERRVETPGYSGRLAGIGVYLEVRDGRVAVSTPIEDTPASRAGIRSGDVILTIDGQSVAGLALPEVVLRIRGPAGTDVTLTLQRADGTGQVDLTLVRAEIRLVSARGQMVAPAIGLLRLTAFTAGSDEETGAVLDELGQAGARALVLDLRGNAGGLLEPVVAVASRFVPAGPIAWREDSRGERQPYDRHADRALIDWPLAVLLDGGTASAAEVFAAAMRDAGRAPLIGQRTYGKATIQHLHELSDGSGLHVTTARWVSPAGTRLDQGGLTPDIPVDTARTDAADPALEQAIQHLHQLLPIPTEPTRAHQPRSGWVAGIR